MSLSDAEMIKSSGWRDWDTAAVLEWAKAEKLPYTFRRFVEVHVAKDGLRGEDLPKIDFRQIDGLAKPMVAKVRCVLQTLDIPEAAPCFELGAASKQDKGVGVTLPSRITARAAGGGSPKPSSSAVLLICPKALADELIGHFHEVSPEGCEVFDYFALPCSACLCIDSCPAFRHGCCHGPGNAASCPLVQGCAEHVSRDSVDEACRRVEEPPPEGTWPQVNYLKGALDILRLYGEYRREGTLLSVRGERACKPREVSSFPSDYVVVASVNLPSKKSSDYAHLDVGLTAIGKWSSSDGDEPGEEGAAFHTAVRETKEELFVDISAVLTHNVQGAMRASLSADDFPYAWRSNQVCGSKGFVIAGHIFYAICDSSIELVRDGRGMAKLDVASPV